MVSKYIGNLARILLGKPFESLDRPEQKVIEALASRETIVEDVNEMFQEQSTFWQRLADKLAAVVGSWPFIIGFLCFLFIWMGINTVILSRADAEFDPYPYILLNLVLSTLASIQAPIIMMSQNRQNEKDRIASQNAYEVNLKIELAIEQLHKKIDQLYGSKNKNSTPEN